MREIREQVLLLIEPVRLVPFEVQMLQVYCPACRTISQVDLSAIDVHRKATLTSLIPRLSCRRCSPHAPFAKLKGITEFREEPWRNAEPLERTGSR